ncbi:MAG: VCBS repeat-containing protein [Deltaproteobacteria bacterium]|nr:MAG: VCBS repeat-containing protein [Deltaproteobacteria bacterium]
MMKRTLPLFLCIACTASNDAEVLLGGPETSEIGGGVLAHDVDGDEQADLLVVDTFTEGAVYVFHGPVTGPLVLDDADLVVALDEGGCIGPSLAAGRLLEGGASAFVFSDGCSSPGELRIVPGELTGFVTPGTLDRLAVSEMAPELAVGDLDGDGIDELIAANEQDVTLWTGPLSFDAAPVATQRRFGGQWEHHVAVADIDGDGRDDVVLGRPRSPHPEDNERGEVHVFLDAMTNLADPDLSFIGPAAGDFAGSGVAVTEDLDGDGLRDIAFGMAHFAPRGALAFGLTDGSLVEVASEGDYDNHQLGRRVVDVGDLDGDGLSEVAVAGWDGIHDGVDRSIVQIVDAEGEVWRLRSRGFDFGASMAGGADLDGDGLDDLVIGDPDTARVHVVWGR